MTARRDNDTTEQLEEPDSTAVRTALWRALHVEVDAAPHVLDDDLGWSSWPPRRVARAARHGSARHATAAMLAQLAGLAHGSTVVMSFLLPVDLVEEVDRAGLEMSTRGARSSGTPFVSFFTPAEIATMVRDAGFLGVRHVAGRAVAERYFAGRPDGLRPSSGEDLVVATT